MSSADLTWLVPWAARWAWALGGGLLLVVALAWRQLHRGRVRSRLAAAVRDADPARRRAAVVVAADQGLRAYSGLLAGRIDTETDPSVRAALADAVLRNAWEPADRPSILRLRLWAHEEAARRTAVRTEPATAPVALYPAAGYPVAALPAPVPLPRRVGPGMPRHRAPSPMPFPLLAERRG